MEFDRLELVIKDNAQEAANKIDLLTGSLSALRGATANNAGLTGIGKKLQEISEASKTSDFSALQGQITEITTALAGLSNLGKNNLSTFMTSLRAIPKVTAGLDPATVASFATAIQGVTDAVKPLGTEMEKIAMGFKSLPVNVQSFITKMEKSKGKANEAKSAYISLSDTLNKLNTAFWTVFSLKAMQGTWNKVQDMTKSMSDYIEDLNLFTVSMGEFAGEAQRYAETLERVMSIDSMQFMSNLAIFQKMATGFGLTSDAAYIMSTNLTQLAYDMASFYNISTDSALEKLRSAMAGQSRPLRELGYTTEQAMLQQVAFNLGIDQSVSTMNRAQKAQLTYIAIMQQSNAVMGDMARTINTPEAATRMLNSQITLLSRSIGSVLIPILIKVIPYVIAFVKVLRMAADAVASFMGFKLPVIDYSGVGDMANSFGDVEDEISGATSAAKKFKDYVMGIDELNIISQPTASGGAGAGGFGGGFDLPFDDSIYDFMGGLTEQSDALVEKMKDLAKTLALVGAGLFIWKNVAKLADAYGAWKIAMEGAGASAATFKMNAAKLFAGIAGGVAIFATFNNAAYKLSRGIKMSSLEIGVSLVAIVGGIGALAFALGSLPLALAVGAVVAFVGAIYGANRAMRELAQEAAVSRLFAPNGGTPVAEITRRLNEMQNATANMANDIHAHSNAFYMYEQAIDDSANAIAAFGDLTKLTQEELANALPQIVAEFTKMRDAIVNQGLEIEMALLGIEAASGRSTEALRNDVAGVVEATVGSLDALIEEYNTLRSEISRGINVESNTARLNEVIMEYMALTDTSMAAYENFNRLANLDTIDFSALVVAGDPTATLQAFRDWEESIEEGHRLATDNIAEGRAAMMAMLADMQMSPEDRARLEAGINELFDGMQAEIDDQFTEVKNASQNQLAQALSEMEIPETWGFELFGSDWMSPFESEAARRAAYWSEVLGIEFSAQDFEGIGEQSGTDLLSGLAKGLMGNTGVIRFNAKKAGQIAVDGVNEGAGNRSPSRKTQESGENVLKGLALGLANTGLLNALKSSGSRIGADTIKGVDDGMLSSQAAIMSTATAIGRNIPTGMLNGINGMSSSVINASKNLGANISGGVSQGIDSNLNKVNTSLSNMLNSMGTKFNQFGVDISNHFDSIIANFANSMNSVKVSGGNVSHSSGGFTEKIRAYAGGGIATSGQLFMANENGRSELVGQFGNNTGIMNSGQIVESVTAGVESGVVRAMAAQGGGTQVLQVVLNDTVVAEATVSGQRNLGNSSYNSTAQQLK